MKKTIWLWILLGVLVLGLVIESVIWIGYHAGLRQTNNANTSLTITNTVLNVNTNVNTNANSDQTSTGKSNLIASMQAFQSGQGFKGDKTLEGLAQDSWLSLLESSSFTTYLTNLKSAQARNVEFMKNSPFSSNRDVVGEFVWNVVEPTEGEFDWTMPDAAMQAAGEAGVTVSAVVQPFSNWDSVESVPVEKCVGIDFVFMNYKGGLPTHMDKYQNFLTALVERYDGDGQDDMPGLTTRVAAWEVGNEYEGSCSGNLNQAANYVTLLKTSYATIKQADAAASVLNAGALEIIGGNGLEITATIDFWKSFFDLGGAAYVDIFNVHYNRERSEQADNLDIWQKQIDFFRALLDDYGYENTSLWITEYGTFGGTIQTPGRPDGQSGITLTRTVEEQASWYFRTMVTGVAAGTQRFFFDLSGNDNSGIGSSSWFRPTGEAREFTTTVIGVAQALEGATLAEKLAEGQYKFTTPDTTVYALWEGDMPAEITGLVTLMTLDGTVAPQESATITYSEAAPVLVIVHPDR